MADRDVELKQMMAEEGSRGRKQPVRAADLEQRRQIRRIAKLIEDPECYMKDYQAVIRDDFGHEEGSPMYLRYMKLWRERRGG
jgi:hypothetical protein